MNKLSTDRWLKFKKNHIFAPAKHKTQNTKHKSEMKKVFMLIAAIAITVSALAQRGQGLQIGAGYENDFYSYSPNGAWNNLKSADGYHVTVAYPFALTDKNAISVGLRWSNTFYFTELGVGEINSRNDVSFGFISLPIKFEQHFGGFFFNVGPTVSYWAMAKNKVSLAGTTVSTVNMFESSDKDDVNRFDVAAGAALGYDFRHIRIAAAYDYGFLSNVKDNVFNFKVNRQSLRISVAYIF